MDNKSFVRYKIFQKFANIEAFTSTKTSFQKDRVRFTGDEETVYSDNRKELARLLNIEIGQLVFPRQTHSDTVCDLDTVPKSEISDTDALVTNKPGICLCVQTADCVPVLLFDPGKKVIAAVHAGWRGTVAKIVANTVNVMKEKYGCDPKTILVAIGPSIGPEVYEVGDEVVEAVRRSIPNAEDVLIKHKSGKFHVDLWVANRNVLLECGISIENIEVLAECSFQGEKKYFSARREGVDTGRMVSGIMMIS